MPRMFWLSVVAFSVLSLGGCGGSPESGVVVGDVGTALDEYLTRITPFGFSGAALVVRDGEVVLNRGYGMASVADGTPNTAGTVFTIGSITKQFTAAAIMKLEMEGALNTEDLLGAHIEGVPEDKAAMTLHHLLTHTAGVIGSTGDDYEEVGRDEVVRRILDAPLSSEPGSEMRYSNAGYSLLAAVVELVSGSEYEEFLNERLFAPAGMHLTGYVRPGWRGETVARWYAGASDNGTPLDRPFPFWNLVGNGGILSTTGDMHLWYEALKGEEILSAAAKEKLFTPFLDDYAYGWDVLETDRGKLIQHDGANTLGASAEFRWFVDADVVVIVFCNSSFEGAPLLRVVRDEIETLSFGGDVDLPPEVLPPDGDHPEEHATDYRLPSGGRYRVAHEGGVLRLVTLDQDAINVLFAEGEVDTFAHADLNVRSVRLVGAAVSGNSEHFVRDIEDEEWAERVHHALVGLLERFTRVNGAPARAAVALGTAPVGRDSLLLASVRLRNELGAAEDIGFFWRGERLVGLDDTGYQVSFPIARVSGDSFVGYHLGFGRAFPLRFESEGEEERGALVLEHGRATGLRAHSHDHDDGQDHGTEDGDDEEHSEQQGHESHDH